MTPRKLKQKPYDITIVEVLVHRKRIKAFGIVDANERARELWDEYCTYGFKSETLGRSDIIGCDEEVHHEHHTLSDMR